MDLDSERFDVVGTVSATREVGKIELDLIPALIQSHRHRADERFHTGRALVVGSAEATPYVFVVKYLYLEREVFLELKKMVRQKWYLHS